MKHVVSVAYSLSVACSTNFKLDEVLETLAGKHAGSSGGGFGQRDLQFYFDTTEERAAVRRRIEQDGRFEILSEWDE